jgi:hypothetical protein
MARAIVVAAPNGVNRCCNRVLDVAVPLESVSAMVDFMAAFHERNESDYVL